MTTYGVRVRTDAATIQSALETRFLHASRRDLRIYTGIAGDRLYRALLHLERKGILLAEHQGKLAMADRLYDLRNTEESRHSNAMESRVGFNHIDSQ